MKHSPFISTDLQFSQREKQGSSAEDRLAGVVVALIVLCVLLAQAALKAHT